MSLAEDIKQFFKGEVLDDDQTLSTYSHDMSLLEVRPKLVVYPKDREDLKQLVRYARDHKEADPSLSITMRAAGSCMSGGPLGESIVADVSHHINKLSEVRGESVVTETGVFYRDLEEKTLKQNLLLPCYPASKSLCALGGMIANNCGGEKTLTYGKMENFVLESKVIFSDGEEYIVKPLSKSELESKVAQDNFEGHIYKELSKLIEENRDRIQEAKPQVSKNSAGYYLWNVWQGEMFDLNRLLVGSQGTLGIVTEAKVRLVPVKKYHDMVALFFKSWDELPQVVNAVMPHGPESLETFDEETLKLGIRFMPEVAKRAGMNLFSFATQFIPEVMIGVRMGGLPKLVVLVEVVEDSQEEVRKKVKNIVRDTMQFDIYHRVIDKDSEEDKFWVMRRESFRLLREHSGGKRTAPFVEDFCIKPDKVPEFLPRALEILKEYGIEANIAGHAGDGNFHIIPLMDFKLESERGKIVPVSEKFYDLIREFGGTISGEHNDGIIRTPFLNKMYSPEVLELFKKTKEIFDPKSIFNPGKKVGGSIEYLESHIVKG